MASRKKGVTGKKLRRAVFFSYVSGALGAGAFCLTAPQQQIVPVFFRNYLGGTSSELGLFLGCILSLSLFHLLALALYSLSPRKKQIWLLMTLIQRLNTFLLAWVAFSIAGGRAPREGIPIVVAVAIAQTILIGMASPGWWTWMTEVFPATTRSTLFARRSAIMQVTNVIVFLSATFFMDFLPEKIFFVFGFVYLGAGILGLLGLVLHLPIPEITTKRIVFHWREFLAPLRHRTFFTFCGTVGVTLILLNFVSPFIAPYITSPDGLNIPKVWLGIMLTISQLTWAVTARFWGVVMDRLGKKPVVVVGVLFSLSWIGYLFITPENYFWILPLIAFTGGFFAPAFFEGVTQLMLSLLPREEGQTAYVAWFWAFYGLSSAVGALLGGMTIEALSSVRGILFGLDGFQVLIGASLIIIIATLLLYTRIQVPKEQSFRRVVQVIARPRVFRSYAFMGVIGRSVQSRRVEEALRSVDDTSGELALANIIMRLDDPEVEVREEAARSLGRIASEEGIAALISRLRDPTSPLRSAAARSLGRAKSTLAIPYLIEGLAADSPEDLQEACANALGMIDGEEATAELLKVLRESRAEKVLASSAGALSKKRKIDAAYDIYHLMQKAESPVLKNQLAIAFGNLLGRPGEFHVYVTGEETQKSVAIEKLFREVKKNLSTLDSLVKTLRAAFLEKHIVREVLSKVEENFDAEEYVEAVKGLNAILINLVYLHHRGHRMDDDSGDVSDQVLCEDRSLHLGRWYVARLHQRETLPGKVEVLLGLYFLSRYRPRLS